MCMYIYIYICKGIFVVKLVVQALTSSSSFWLVRTFGRPSLRTAKKVRPNCSSCVESRGLGHNIREYSKEPEGSFYSCGRLDGPFE